MTATPLEGTVKQAYGEAVVQHETNGQQDCSTNSDKVLQVSHSLSGEQISRGQRTKRFL